MPNGVNVGEISVLLNRKIDDYSGRFGVLPNVVFANPELVRKVFVQCLQSAVVFSVNIWLLKEGVIGCINGVLSLYLARKHKTNKQ